MDEPAAFDAFADFVAAQKALDRPAERVQRLVDECLRSTGGAENAVRSALRGTWLGHPLHPVLTDFPIGAWTLASILDVYGLLRRRRSKTADIAIALGNVGAAAAALAGLADWQVLDGRPRRIGFVHGIFNGAATALLTLSLAPLPTRGLVFSRLAGYTLATAAGLLGGALVFRERVGVRSG